MAMLVTVDSVEWMGAEPTGVGTRLVLLAVYEATRSQDSGRAQAIEIIPKLPIMVIADSEIMTRQSATLPNPVRPQSSSASDRSLFASTSSLSHLGGEAHEAPDLPRPCCMYYNWPIETLHCVDVLATLYDGTLTASGMVLRLDEYMDGQINI